MTVPPSDAMRAPSTGWLLARADGSILAADEAFCALIGAPAPQALIGQYWPALVAGGYGGGLEAARAAEARGERWSGVLLLGFGGPPRPLQVEVLGAGSGPGRATVLRASEPAGGLAADPSGGDTAVALETAEAVEEAVNAYDASRAALRAVRQAVEFDWAVVLRFTSADGAEVLATYPSAMAGVERGISWSPLDEAERAVLETGEPALDGDLARGPDERSPLARLAAFGMRSRLQVPLYARGDVAGCISLYAVRPQAFTPGDGIRLERFLRPLRTRIAELARSAPALPSTPKAEAAPEPPPPPAAEAQEPQAEPEAPADDEAPTQPQTAESRAEAAEPEAEAVPRHSRGAADQRLTALGEMVSGVAHELNNPLTAILGYAEMLPELEGGERDQALRTIEREALRAGRIVRNLLAFARQHRGTMRPVDVEATLRRVLEARREGLAADGIAVETSFTGVPPVQADEQQLEQVFANLVENAQQAMHPGGGALHVATKRAPEAVRIVVRDTGAGVPDEVADRVFEPFFTTREVGAGAGMGLAIVYGIVSEHGGRVWVERPEGRGAQFVIELPLDGPAPAEPAAETRDEPAPSAQPEAAVEPPQAAPEALRQEPAPANRPSVEPRTVPETGRARVLVVDDELGMRAVTNEILGGAGYGVEAAAGGEEGLRLLEAEPYDAVIVDLRMPGMDGERFFHSAVERWPHLRRRTVVVTADVESDPAAERLLREGVHLLEKPFDSRALVEAVERALRQKA